MDIRKEYLKLRIKGIPKVHINVSWESAPIMSFARFQRFVTQISPQHLLLAHKDDGEIINRILSDELYSAKDIGILDFAEYFRNSFESKDKGIPTAKVLYIYNVGDEEANSYAFSDKKLFGVIQKNLQQGNCVIVVSNTFTITTFKRNYPIVAEKITVAQQIKK